MTFSRATSLGTYYLIAASIPFARGRRPFISAPRSCYLTANIVASVISGGGIDIAARGVTLDLNGFQISGGGNTRAGVGIHLEDRATNCAIRNGSITSFQAGLACTYLDPIGYSPYGRISQVDVSGCFVGLKFDGLSDFQLRGQRE